MNKVRIMPKGHWDWSMPVSFSQGWKVGKLIFVGGQVPRDESGNTVGEGDIEKQTHNVFQNIEAVLKEVGADFGDIVKLSTFYAHDNKENPDLFKNKITQVAMDYFPSPGPAVTEVQIAGFARDGVFVEIEAIAVVNK